MPRRLMLAAVVINAGCDRGPRFDPDGPTASRLTPNSGAVVRPEYGRTTGAGENPPVYLQPGGPPGTPDVEIEPGTQLRVIDDGRPAKVDFLTAPDVDRTKVDWRPVKVEALGGRRKGIVGDVTRYNIRPAQSEDR